MEKATARDFYADLKALAADEGRAPEQVLILPGLSPVIGSTETEAQRFARELNDLSDPEVGRKRLSGRFGGHDFSHLKLDEPLSPEDFPDPGTVQAARSRTEVIIGLVRRERPTLRQLLGYMAGARGHFVTAGTPEQIADLIEDWFRDGAADGFNLMPPVLPAMLEVFIAEVVPLLQRRGLFRSAYAGQTLRDALRSGAAGHGPLAAKRRGQHEARRPGDPRWTATRFRRRGANAAPCRLHRARRIVPRVSDRIPVRHAGGDRDPGDRLPSRAPHAARQFDGVAGGRCVGPARRRPAELPAAQARGRPVIRLRYRRSQNVSHRMAARSSTTTSRPARPMRMIRTDTDTSTIAPARSLLAASRSNRSTWRWTRRAIER